MEIVKGKAPATPVRTEANRQAENALQELCEIGKQVGKGFDPETLGQRLLALCVTARPQNYKMPQVNLLRYGEGEADRFTLKKLARMGKDVELLIDDIRRLKRTPLVVWLQIRNRIPINDVLFAPDSAGLELRLFQIIKGWPVALPDDELLKSLETSLKTVRSIREIAQRQRADSLDIDYSLSHLCKYVEATCGGPNDRLLSAALRPLNIPHANTPEALKVWRNRKSQDK